VQKRPGLLKKL